MPVEKTYKLSIDPRILELLGPSLYTNIYYVLAELIANAYDADAKNVYIIANRDDITVEDDGHGMSYQDGDIANYLNVGGISRSSEEEALTRTGERKKMGRKGVGKLAALSVSENVLVKTKTESEVSGFVLSRHPADDDRLMPIPDDQITFERVTEHGSAIVMQKPQYRLHANLRIVSKNLLKIFPQISSDFRIHIIRNRDEVIIDDFDGSIMGDLCTFISLGDEFKELGNLVPSIYPERRNDLVKNEPCKTIPVRMNDNQGVEHEYSLEVKGWIGAYKSTRGRKVEMTDFPDNFISLFANKKMGEFNILPVVGQNKLNEVYIVGQLHVDLFELTELPDMALSNRQGYKSDDPRYEAVLQYVRAELLPAITKAREAFTDIANAERTRQRLEMQRQKEAVLTAEVGRYRNNVLQTAENRIAALGGEIPQAARQRIMGIFEESMNINRLQLGLKCEVDSLKKRILISQTLGDKPFADIVYQMLIHNRVPAEDILYTNCDSEVSRIPEDAKVYEYLRDFFVNSISTRKIFVLFVTSENTKKSWGALTEVGAAWITQIDHKIFNIHPFRPEHPLDDESQWQSTNRNTETSGIWMSRLNADIFCQKVEAVCDKLGYKKQSRDNNRRYLETLVDVRL